jgi:hypothetical protein
VTALSCFAIGIAFAIAVGLLIFAGVTIGCLLPPRLRLRRTAGPKGRDSLTPPASRD